MRDAVTSRARRRWWPGQIWSGSKSTLDNGQALAITGAGGAKFDERSATTALTSLAVTGPTALERRLGRHHCRPNLHRGGELGADMTLTGVGVTLSSTVQSPDHCPPV